MVKLVRDRIPEIVVARSGKDLPLLIASHESRYALLWNKLEEEIAELKNAIIADEFCEEVGDIIEVLKCLVDQGPHKSLNWEKVIMRAGNKTLHRGSFTKGYVLDTDDLT